MLFDDSTFIYGWCPADAVEVLAHHAAVYKDKSTSINHRLVLNIKRHAGLWGEPDAAHWSQDAWTRLLLHLPRYRVRGRVEIRVHHTVPLTGLPSCLLHQAHLLSQCESVTVWSGRIELAELQELINLVQECLQAGVKLELWGTTIVTPEGADRDQVRDLLESTGVVRLYTIV